MPQTKAAAAKVVDQMSIDAAPGDILAQAIVRIDEAMAAMMASGLRENALVVLIHHKTKVPADDIWSVLNALKTLRQNFTTL